MGIMANPAVYDIKYYSGDTYTLLIYPKTASGSAFDLSAYTGVTFDIADQRGTGSGREKYRLTPEISTTNNTILVTLTPTAGALLDASKTYYYDVTITGPATYTLLTGTITISQAVVGA